MKNFFSLKWRTAYAGFLKSSWQKKVSIVLTVVFLVSFGLVHLRLISDTFYVDDKNSIHSTIEGYGDIPLHLTQISKFAFSSFDFSEPIFYGNKLKYPFLFNMLRGWMLKVTGLWAESVLWPVYFLAMANIILLFAVYKKLLQDNFWAIAAFLIFFLGSGVNSGKFPVTNARYPKQNIDFSAPLSFSFIHQQTFFLGLFGFLLFLWLLLKTKESSKKGYFIGAGLVFGCLPLAHTHSFVAAAAFFFVILLFSFKKAYPYFKKLLLTLAIGVMMALPQLYFLLGLGSPSKARKSFVQFRLGWMMGSGTGGVQFATDNRSIFSLAFLDFLWANFGIILPLFLLCLTLTLVLFRKKGDGIVLFGLVGLLLFTAVQLIKFQPWDFDNNKLLVYFLFFAAPFMVWFLAHTFRRYKIMQVLVIMIALGFSIFAGVLNVKSRLGVAKDELPVIFNDDAQRLAGYVRLNISDKDLILTGTSHLNPVASLAGRSVLVGYPGWLWTRNIDYFARESEIKRFYQYPDQGSSLFAQFPIAYILINGSVDSYQAPPAVFDKLFPRVFESGRYILYSVSKT